MRVLLVVLHADSSRGGAEGYTLTLFRRLLAEGHDARLAAATFEASVPRDRRVPLAFSGLSRTGRYARFLDALDDHVAANPDELVHAMLPVRRCDVYQPQAGLEAVAWRELPWFKRIGNPRRRVFVETEGLLLKGGRSPITVCLSARMRTDGLHSFGEPGRAVVLHHAVDETHFPPAPPRAAASAPVCVFVGQDFARKGLDVAIAVTAAHPTATLRVVGGDDPAPYRTQADRLGVGGRVAFVGATRDVAAQLRDADAFVFPSRFDAFGMVVVEAMLSGVPPVVAATAGASEVVRDGVDGRVLPAAATPADWAAALTDVLARREAYSAACLARRDGLSYSRHLRTLLTLYDRAYAERRARTGVA